MKRQVKGIFFGFFEILNVQLILCEIIFSYLVVELFWETTLVLVLSTVIKYSVFIS